jgi:hypothetical protein
LADGAFFFAAHGANHLLLGHLAAEASQGSFDQAKIAEFLSQSHYLDPK